MTGSRPRSVADFGCGSGGWLEVWRELGVVDLTGVESEPPLEPASCNWKVGDLTRPLDLGRKVDLVQCLEVGEHLPAPPPQPWLRPSLDTHRRFFSAALPGQGGWQHLNERPAAYWRQLFAEHGFALFDCLRPRLKGQAPVRLSSAHNTFIYAHRDVWPNLPSTVSQSRIAPERPITDTSPFWLRVARAFVRIWPVTWVSRVDRALQIANHQGNLLRCQPALLDGRSGDRRLNS